MNLISNSNGFFFSPNFTFFLTTIKNDRIYLTITITLTSPVGPDFKAKLNISCVNAVGVIDFVACSVFFTQISFN